MYAQLYTPDGRCHGLHSFVVQVRSTVDLSPLPGVTVGDLGEKLGQNGLDNGYDCFFFLMKVSKLSILTVCEKMFQHHNCTVHSFTLDIQEASF